MYKRCRILSASQLSDMLCPGGGRETNLESCQTEPRTRRQSPKPLRSRQLLMRFVFVFLCPTQSLLSLDLHLLQHRLLSPTTTHLPSLNILLYLSTFHSSSIMRASSRDLTQAVVALLAASTVSHALSIEGRASTCNGHSEVREFCCSRFALFLKGGTGS